MKKIFNLLLIAVAALGIHTSCSDIPSPYDIMGGGSYLGKGLPYKSANLNTGWTTVCLTENEPWSKGSNYIQATGYQDWGSGAKSNEEVESYLVSPAFNTTCESGKVKISFDQTIRYTDRVADWQNNHKILISKTYNETEEWNAEDWEELEWTPVASPYSDWTLYSSGEIQIPEAYVNQEEVRLAFYFYAPASNSTTWELQNFLIQEGEATEGGNIDNPEGIEITCAQAIELCAALADGASSAETYSITGYITDVFANISNNQQSFWISDENDGSKMVQAYWANLPEGVSAFSTGMKVTITGQLLKYVKNGNVTTEVKNATVVILEEGTGGGTTDGTEITCAKAVELCAALADGGTSTETYTVTGYITDVFANISNNQQSFWMADTKDGGKVLQAYWANLPAGVSAFKLGSKVKITGKLLKYVKNGEVTTEIKNANVVILEEGNGNDNIPTTGTEINCAKAAELCSALADGGTSSETYSVTGYITDVFANISSNQQSFWMADTKDGGKVLQAYWANLPQGVSAFKLGSKVKITGKLLKYVKNGEVTPEIKNATVVILEEGDGGNNNNNNNDNGGSYADGISVSENIMTWTNAAVAGTSSGCETVDMSRLGYENSNVVAEITTDLFTINFAKNSGSYESKYYSTTGPSVRVYAGNKVTVTANSSTITISKIVLTCEGTDYLGQSTATFECSAGKMVYANVGSANTQLRIKKMEIYYKDATGSAKVQRFAKNK